MLLYLGISMVTLRGRIYCIYRRVPSRYASVDSRSFVTLSLHTDSKTLAEEKAVIAWAKLVEGWEIRLSGDQAGSVERFDAARELAAYRGFRYVEASSVAELPLPELMARVQSVPVISDEPNRIEAAAVLGGVARPMFTVSTALEIYWSLAADDTLGKSKDQIQRWKGPRIKAIKNFITVVGDKRLDEITGDDMLDFRSWWWERISAGDVTTGSGNKDFIHFGNVLKTVNCMKRLNLDLPLSDLSFKNSEPVKRPPFSSEWIREKLLAPKALEGLNDEAEAIFLAMINTGARPSELAGLTSSCIHLDCEVPYISIEPVGRQLKSANARRIIPLVGISLNALKAFPEGFPRYQNSSASLSATVNKFLRENDLMQSSTHTVYSLRHGFEDRLLAAGVDERIRRDLLGHALNRERYGAGASLEHMKAILDKVAL